MAKNAIVVKVGANPRLAVGDRVELSIGRATYRITIPHDDADGIEVMYVFGQGLLSGFRIKPCCGNVIALHPERR